MIAPESASTALEGVWQIMVELAETVNDEIVLNQRTPSTTAAAIIDQRSKDLADIARAAAILLRLANAP